MGATMLNNRFLEEAIFAIADGYCTINLTKNFVPGVMYQVVDGKRYNLNEQIGLPENASFTDLVQVWARTVPQDGIEEFLKNFDRKRLLSCFLQNETHVSFSFWTRTAKFEPMFAENHIAMFQDMETGDVMAVNYVLDRTKQYMLKRQKEELEKKQQQLEKALEESNRKNEVIMAISRLYWQVFCVDLKTDTYKEVFIDGKLTIDNPAYTGIAKKDFLLVVNAFVDEEYKEKLEAFVDHHTISDRLSKTDTIAIEFQTKEKVWVSARYIAQTRDQKGNVTEVLFLIQQIDEQKRKELDYQKKLQQAVEEAKRANEMKSRFLSSISHDIRTPINGIQGMLRIADTYPHDMKKQNECREKMWMASNHLVSLVNNVLDMNHLENNVIDLKEEPFNLIDLLMSITAMTDIQVEAKGLHSIVDWKPGYIEHRYLIGSSEGLSRILMNLNSNAIKYNKPGGTIYCRCLEKECDGETAWFEIINSDTGIGMDEEFLKSAFEPYSRKNNVSLSSINGVGLGLSIVKKTVQMMGGTLKVESKVGKGTKYTILLPFKINSNPHKKEKKSLEHVNLKGVKALLVEDNDLNMEIAKFHLEQQQMEVFTAVNGAEAVKAFENSEIGFYDIVLMDIMMPVMDGLEATRQIRNLNRPDAIAVPIVAMSANAFQEDIEKSLEAGMNAHLVKPLDGEKVIDTIKNYLANKLLEADVE